MKKFALLTFAVFIGILTNMCFADEQEAFYGHWIIKRVIARGPVSAYSSADERKLLGKEIVFSEDSACFDNASKVRPFYKKTTFSDNDFQEEYNTDLERIGVKKNSIVQIEVFTDRQFETSWDSVGNTILIKGSNILVLFDSGVFFELTRK